MKPLLSGCLQHVLTYKYYVKFRITASFCGSQGLEPYLRINICRSDLLSYPPIWGVSAPYEFHSILKMVYSALLRFSLPQSRWYPLSILCIPMTIRQVGLGGKREIRTPGPFRIVGFQDRWFKPLTHLTMLPSGEGCCFMS